MCMEISLWQTGTSQKSYLCCQHFYTKSVQSGLNTIKKSLCLLYMTIRMPSLFGGYLFLYLPSNFVYFGNDRPLDLLAAWQTIFSHSYNPFEVIRYLHTCMFPKTIPFTEFLRQLYDRSNMSLPTEEFFITPA